MSPVSISYDGEKWNVEFPFIELTIVHCHHKKLFDHHPARYHLTLNSGGSAEFMLLSII
jgi:hypothetical protein